jgi:hypothetical protein
MIVCDGIHKLRHRNILAELKPKLLYECTSYIEISNKLALYNLEIPLMLSLIFY